jgi:hypothetical protein
MEAIKEGSSSRAGYLNESSSSESDFNLNSSMPHNSDTDICGPHTGSNGEFPCHNGLMTDLYLCSESLGLVLSPAKKIDDEC